jgi:hypothetical protein
MLCCMAPRRKRGATDSLNPVNEPRWLVVRDACSRAIEFQALAPGAGLRAALKTRTAVLAADGWQIGDIPRNCSFVFCERGNERLCVGIECYEPGTAGLGHG